jgi:hypothetical protein
VGVCVPEVLEEPDSEEVGDLCAGAAVAVRDEPEFVLELDVRSQVLVVTAALAVEATSGSFSVLDTGHRVCHLKEVGPGVARESEADCERVRVVLIDAGHGRRTGVVGDSERRQRLVHEQVGVVECLVGWPVDL